MKTKRRYVVGGVVVLLVMLLTGFGLVVACGPWGNCGGGFHPRFQCGVFAPGFHKKDFGQFLLWRLDKKAEELDLSEVQQEKYNEIRSGIEEHLETVVEDREKLMETLHAEMGREDPDMTLLADALRQKVRGISRFLERNLDLFVAFYEGLDEAQKDQVLKAIRERMKDHPS